MSDAVTQPGWVPIRVYQRTSRTMVDWCFLGQERFSDPFFEETINRCLRHPFALLFRHQTPIEALEELEPLAPPSGFIFHMSRCGSTLVSQMLAAVPSNIVISEAVPLDDLLRANRQQPALAEERRIRRLRGMVAALSRPRNQGERHVVIKFDCWNTFDLPLIRRAFPNVPWVFLYRDPVEVLVSHRRMPGSQIIPGALDPQMLGLSQAQLAAMPFEEYGAFVLARICQAAADYVDERATLINYRQLPDVVTSCLLDTFQVDYPPEALARMRDATRYHAKNPIFEFTADSQAKREAAGESLRALAERVMRPSYERLEAINRAQFVHM
jgi:hypothetical protein